VVTGEKTSRIVAHACLIRRLEWVLPEFDVSSTVVATRLCKYLTAIETSTIVILRPYVPVGTKRTSSSKSNV
jgi:hypothetical protein